MKISVMNFMMKKSIIENHVYGYKKSSIVRSKILLFAEIPPLQMIFPSSAAVLIEKDKKDKKTREDTELKTKIYLKYPKKI